MNSILRKMIRQILVAGSTAAFVAGTPIVAQAAIVPGVQLPPPGPGQIPDYFGVTPNYANSPQPMFSTVTINGTGSGAIAVATSFDYANGVFTDHITDIQILEPGSGYTGTPEIIVTNSAGTPFTFHSQVSTDGRIIGVKEFDPTDTLYLNPANGLTIGTGFLTALTGSGIRKFVDPMSAIPVASGIQITDVNKNVSDYYELAEVEFTQKLHSDLPPTHLRGYVEIKPGGFSVAAYKAAADKLAYANQYAKYLGPIIVADKDIPVRVKLVNLLSTGTAGKLPMPVDHTYMGADTGTDNRTAMHLHGGNTPWISDGTARQWVKPKGESGANRGASAGLVPDMWYDASGTLIDGCLGALSCSTTGATNNPGAGALTYYYTNQQSARLMFYHDHAEGITRLNVYAGLASAYILHDTKEQELIAAGTIPGDTDTIPLVIQEKTFVPDNTKPVMNFYGPFKSTLNSQDPTWRWASQDSTWSKANQVISSEFNGNGDLWVPHVFMPNQNPGDMSGANPMGRWDYGPWFWPPFAGIQNGPLPNPYVDPTCDPANSIVGTCEGPTIPGVPNAATIDTAGNPLSGPLTEPSGTPESFNDTPLVNGTVYPYTNVQPKKYRLRILSVGNDRHLNLSMVVASNGKVTDSTELANNGPTSDAAKQALCDGTTGQQPADCTEVRMVPFNASQNKSTPFPSHWYSITPYGTFDGRTGGVFDPAIRGPAMIQIGTEGGFLSTPVVINNQPINYEMNKKNIVVGNVKEHALLLGPAERADVVVDFSKFAGSTIILYNDAPAALPAGDGRLDYFTGDPDNTDTGGAFSTIPGYGPNTRTIMQFRVSDCSSLTSGTSGCDTSHPVDYVDPTYLANLTTAVRGYFVTSQEPIIVPQAAYNVVYDPKNTYPDPKDLPNVNLSTISSTSLNIFPYLLDSATKLPTGEIATVPLTLTLQPKSIIEDWTKDFGRMNAMLGVEVPHTTAINQTSIPQGFIDPPTEIVKISDVGTPVSGVLADGTQLWKITHNGVDTHPVHFHLFHVQLVNRVGWDGAISPPQANELGWKDTVRMNPLEDAIVALRPMTMTLPFKVPNSHHVSDPSNPSTTINSNMSFNLDPTSGNASNVTNGSIKTNYGWEYLWHCHILGHEENDFMRSIAVANKPELPNILSVAKSGNNNTVTWKDNSITANWFEIERTYTNTSKPPKTSTTKLIYVPTVTVNKVKVPTECSSQAGCTRTFSDNVGSNKGTFTYRVRANNTVGAGIGQLEWGYNKDGTYSQNLPSSLVSTTTNTAPIMPNFTGYSNATANSDWSITSSIITR